MGGSVRFIQISDIHLGARVLPRCFSNTSKIRKMREDEILLSLESLKDIAEETCAEVVLVVGDLFDRDSVSAEIVNKTFEIFSALPPVFIVPGNHDYISGASPYSEYERSRRGLTEIPSNVHIFSGGDFTSAYLPNRADVCITAKAFTGNVVVMDHPLAEKIPRDPAEISILLHHGARTQFVFEEKTKITAPFTASELLAQSFSYTALGHYHSYSVIENADGIIKAAYSGRPFACEFHSKDGCVLVGEVTHDGVKELTQYDIDIRKIFDISIYCDNVGSNQELLDLAMNQCIKNEVLKDDIVRLRFVGTKKTEFKPELLLPQEEFFACTGDFSELKLGYDIDELLDIAEGRAATAESLFLKKMYIKIKAANDKEDKINLLGALDYGMKALRGIRIVPSDIIDPEE